MAPAGGGRGYAIGHLRDVTVNDEIVDYMARIESTFAPFGGSWLVHGSEPDVREGQVPGVVVIIGFPSVGAAREWYESASYAAIAELRTRNSRSTVALLDGVPPGYRAADTITRLRSG